VPHATIQRIFGHESLLMVQTYAHVVDETVKRELGAFQRRVIDIRGEEQPGDPRLETADLRRYKQQVRGQALMIGTCGLPAVFQRCPHANACLTCAHWRIATTDVPLIANLLVREERILTRAREHGNRAAVEVGEELVGTLRTVLGALERAGARAPDVPGGSASPVAVARAALGAAMVEAEVALDQARAQGDGALIRVRQERLAELTEQVATLGGASND